MFLTHRNPALASSAVYSQALFLTCDKILSAAIPQPSLTRMLSRVIVAVASFLMLVTFSYAADTSALKPPPGQSVAIVEFLDLQCPDCANANPLLKEAAK